MAKTLDYHTIREIFTRFQDAEAEPKGELDHTNVYTLLVAVALSAQATDAGGTRLPNPCSRLSSTRSRCWTSGWRG